MDAMTKRAKDRVTMYVEVPPAIKAAMEKLAEEHHRSLAGEVITALEQYIAREKAAAKAEKRGG
jgi:predicted transcriptional regulator